MSVRQAMNHLGNEIALLLRHNCNDRLDEVRKELNEEIKKIDDHLYFAAWKPKDKGAENER